MREPSDPGPAPRRQRLTEVGRFLRARRNELRPEDLGLPVGSRRRATGLLREEVASLAGVSTTWYTYLEQGRAVRPSAQVLNSLATALQLTDDERRYLHAVASVPSESPPGPEPIPTDLAAQVVRTIGHTDSPVYAGNLHGDLLAWNDATTAWYTDFGTTAEPNMIRWLLLDPEARQRLPDWADDVRDMVGRLREFYRPREEGDV